MVKEDFRLVNKVLAGENLKLRDVTDQMIKKDIEGISDNKIIVDAINKAKKNKKILNLKTEFIFPASVTAAGMAVGILIGVGSTDSKMTTAGLISLLSMGVITVVLIIINSRLDSKINNNERFITQGEAVIEDRAAGKSKQ